MIVQLRKVLYFIFLPAEQLFHANLFSLQFFKSKSMYDLMSIFSHHANISVVVTSQTFHMSDKDSVKMLRNFSDFCLFLNRGDKTTLRILSSQFFPGKQNALTKIGNWISRNLPNDFAKYLVIDSNHHSSIPDCLQVHFHGSKSLLEVGKSTVFQVRTRIFPIGDSHGAEPIYFYVSEED